MSVLQAANVHFDSSGLMRIGKDGSNLVIKTNGAAINIEGLDVAAEVAPAFDKANTACTAAVAAFAKANSALNSDSSDTFQGGVLTVVSEAGVDITNTSQINGLQIFQSTAGADALITFHISGDYAAHFGIDGGTNKLSYGGWSKGAVSRPIALVDDSGQTGTIYATGMQVSTGGVQFSTNAITNYTVSTSAPTGGNDGDVWVVIT
jgi:hypothetical protein